MGATKFLLTKEIKNQISKYIDEEFNNEILKETVNYIQNERKAEIDDSSFNMEDKNSKINIIDKGKFNVYDYMYFKDFLNDISWEGSYVECETIDEEKPYLYKKTYKYMPKDIGEIIYEKVKYNMEQKKGLIYKEFKKNYTDSKFLFESVRFYKRTRDGKEYYDINEQELNCDKKKSLEERIKTELGNTFKSKWASFTNSKMLNIENEFMLDVYDRGCRLLNLNNEYYTECVYENHSLEEETLIELMKKNCINVNSHIEGIQRLKMKVMNSLDRRLNDLINMKIYKRHEYMDDFLTSARKIVFGYYQSLYERRNKKYLKTKENMILKLIERMAITENTIYSEYKSENEKAPSIKELMEFEDCIPWICYKGPLWTAENIYIKKKAKDELKEIIFDNPIDEYEDVKYMERHFYLHVGETNTGKTYSSIKRLMEAETGVYLAPLRLLALEIQDKLNSENVPCSLLTGEEEDIILHAAHISSTIEKLRTDVSYEVCVIDEAQMISDPQRGWAWTRAIIGVLSPEVHICMAPEALNIIIKLIEECGDTYEIIHHKRDTELIFEEKTFNIDTDVKPGDALVVFGKRKALAVSAELLQKNIKTSIIYGSLPYSTRKKQFERFLSNETDVIVCTDAIGMGVNLPIKRIVFLETKKYDGISLRKLKVSEIKQIAGRAGRKGIYNKGYVAAACDLNLIRNALKAETKPIEKCFTGIPDSLLNIDIDLIDSLKTWSSMSLNGIFAKTDVTRIIYLLNRLKKLKLNISKKDAIKMATIPFEENNKTVYALWEEYCRMYSSGIVNLKRPSISQNISSKKQLDDLESYYKSLDLNYSFGKNFDIVINNEYISSEKEKTANKINDLLLTKLLDHERVCSLCKRKLSWDYPNDICRKCRDSMMEAKKEKLKYISSKNIRRRSRKRRHR